MPPRATVWALDEQTRGKHEVLRCYLNAWLPILGMKQGRIVFIDGFAGPGQYNRGEDGSPIIALQALINRAKVPAVPDRSHGGSRRGGRPVRARATALVGVAAPSGIAP